MNEKHNILYYLSMVILLITFCFMMYAGYLFLIDGNNVLKYNGPMKIVSVDKDTVTVALNYCKERSIPVKVYVSYIDGIVYSLPVKESASLDVGCRTINKIFALPSRIPNGVYHLHVDTEIKVNKFRSDTFSWESENFEVKR